jgi:hypothetical protein
MTLRKAKISSWLLCMGLFSEKACVEFIPGDDQKGPGVRLRGRVGAKSKRGRRQSD